MIISELGVAIDKLGSVDELGSKVELKAISADEELQKAQFSLELVSVYEALAKKFSVSDSIKIITGTVEMFLKSHKSS